MVIKKADQRVEVRSNMRGGNLDGTLKHLAEGVPNCSLFVTLSFEPGGSVGKHDHVTNTEVYYILEGQFEVDDNGTTVILNPGDSVITGGGDYHSIKNISDKTATFLAVIIDN